MQDDHLQPDLFPHSFCHTLGPTLTHLVHGFSHRLVLSCLLDLLFLHLTFPTPPYFSLNPSIFKSFFLSQSILISICLSIYLSLDIYLGISVYPVLSVSANLFLYWKGNFPMAPHVCLSVGWLVGRSVGWSACHNFKF